MYHLQAQESRPRSVADVANGATIVFWNSVVKTGEPRDKVANDQQTHYGDGETKVMDQWQK